MRIIYYTNDFIEFVVNRIRKQRKQYQRKMLEETKTSKETKMLEETNISE